MSMCVVNGKCKRGKSPSRGKQVKRQTLKKDTIMKIVGVVRGVANFKALGSMLLGEGLIVK